MTRFSNLFFLPVLSFVFRLFEFVSNFGFRASDFRMREKHP